ARHQPARRGPRGEGTGAALETRISRRDPGPKRQRGNEEPPSLALRAWVPAAFITHDVILPPAAVRRRRRTAQHGRRRSAARGGPRRRRLAALLRLGPGHAEPRLLPAGARAHCRGAPRRAAVRAPAVGRRHPDPPPGGHVRLRPARRPALADRAVLAAGDA